jgi:hypothetical protein
LAPAHEIAAIRWWSWAAVFLACKIRVMMIRGKQKQILRLI